MFNMSQLFGHEGADVIDSKDQKCKGTNNE
jgi:hypothetical protein